MGRRSVAQKAQRLVSLKRVHAQGRCLECLKPNYKGRLHCFECGKRSAGYGRAYRKGLRAAGVCQRCRGEKERKDRQSCNKCLEWRRVYNNRIYAQEKREAYEAYGGYVCNCCGEVEPVFLTIDHMQNNGSYMRRIHGIRIDRWLKKNNYPEGFQILCWNCNSGRYHNGGICPHQAA